MAKILENYSEAIEQAKQSKKSLAIQVKDGQVYQMNRFTRWISSMFGAATVSTLVIAFFFIIVNEMTGLVRIKKRTPLSWIRRIFVKD